jgi:hypothetical protein
VVKEAVSEYSQIVCDLLEARRSEPSATEVFLTLKHDKDLCPRFQKQIERIFSGFKKYHNVSYDIQGLKDEGVDVLLIEWVDGQKEFVGFQIKGEWDLSQKDFLQKLKAQLHDARARYGSRLKVYYIVLCYSIVSEDKKSKRLGVDKARQEKVKSIIRDFAKESDVRVVEPEFAARFLSLSSVNIDAIIKSRFGNQDIVIKEALALTSDLSMMEKVVLLFLLWLHLFQNQASASAEEIMQSPIIQDLHQTLSREAEHLFYDFEYQITHDVETLQNKLIDCDSNGQFSIRLDLVKPLVVLMMDGSVRYQHGDQALLEYTLRLLEGLDDPEDI